MANLDGKKVEKALKKKGFIEDSSGDHKYFILHYEGKDTAIRTKTSHNNQDIGDGLIKQMYTQLHIEKSFFVAFIDCSKSQEDYINELKNQNLL